MRGSNRDSGRIDMNKKVFLATALEKLLYIAAADLMAMLVKLILNLIAKPIVDEIMSESSEIAKANAGKIFSGIYILAFVILLAVLIIKNPSPRTAYLNATYGEDYSFKKDLFVITPLPTLLVSAVFALPMSLVLAIFGDIKIVPLFFVPYYSMWEIVRNPWISYAIMTVMTAALIILFTEIAHVIWEKNRLRK